MPPIPHPTSCAFQVPNLMSLFHCLSCTKESVLVRDLVKCNMVIFYGEKLLAPPQTPKLEDHPLSAVRDCLFNAIVFTFVHGGRSSIRNLRTRHAVVTGTHLSRALNLR
jgi:hypothetical protein